MPSPETRALFFLHVPKTGGTSLRDLLATRFAPSDVVAFERKDSTDALQDKLGRLDRALFVHGHIPYALVERFARRPYVVTILRDPVDRAVSAFRYMRIHAPAMAEAAKSGKVSATRAGDYAAAARLPLGAFLRDAPAAAARHLGNVQAWLLSARRLTERFDYRDDYEVTISHDDLMRAKQHLASCDVVALTERLDESLPLFAHALAVRPFAAIGTANRTAAREPLVALDDATSAALADLTAQDRALYAYAQKLFEERLASLPSAAARAPAPAERPFPALSNVCTFDAPIPGDGWYGQECAGDRWFSWTGPTSESTIALASPNGAACCQFTMAVEHAWRSDVLTGLDVRLNGVSLELRHASHATCHILTALVDRTLLRPANCGNIIVIRVPALYRPSDAGDSDDSRLLGIAVSRVELSTS